MLTKFFKAAACGLFLGLPGVGAAQDATIMIEEAYARASSPNARAGAAFMQITNMAEADDRLIAATSPAAQRVELHTHIEDEGGVMRMRRVEGGFALPAGGTIALKRGGDHVMFMGLTQVFAQGSEVEVTLSFETAGEMTVIIPVDNARKVDHGAMGHDH